MASTYTESTAGTQLLDHPAEAEPFRHRLPRQARTGAPLLGVTAMTAALGATGLAAAPAQAAAPAPAPVTATDGTSDGLLAADPGLALAARILQQADGQRPTTEESARLAAAQEAEARHADRRAGAAAAEDTATEDAAAGNAVAEAAETAADRSAPALPLADYRLTEQYAPAGAHWAHLHTGLDFAARTGTPVTAVTGGTVTAAGWSGTYGYRVVQTLPDGTELWYCQLSRIATASGPVAPGTVLGAVGTTGNATTPHLHLEVRPAGGAPVDPLPWLRHLGLQP
ncbi:M23 family metallopeptidase [Kitasatospora phosalacinea]|uniref:M23 family metallopeptidase n=1 Tax=Kitasatospora phosalacinea TaxID=2065 RepID=UPI0036509134